MDCTDELCSIGGSAEETVPMESEEERDVPEAASVLSSTKILQNSFDERGVFYDGALFISRLRSNLKIPLSTVNDITAGCSEMLSPATDAVRQNVQLLVDEFNIPSDRVQGMMKLLDVIADPFNGISTEWKQHKFFERNGYYIPPHTFNIDSYITSTAGEVSCKVKNVTGQFVSLRKVLETFLKLPGVLQHVINHLQTEHKIGDLITDFCHGELWRDHPVRLKHSGQEKTVVIPVFDFYDDLETANPLGSHAVIHKVGVKYTVVKGFSPIVNSKLENIFLNMVINSSERTTHGVFDIYLDEMSKLETEGFSVTLDDGESYKVFVVMVQVIGDNLGLNGLLGYRT